jgi:hypothetical protein
LTILIISYIGALEAGARSRHLRRPDADFSVPNAQSEKPVDLDFYTGQVKMQAPRQIKGLGRRP